MTATCAALEVSESKFHEWMKKGEQGEKPYAEFRKRTLCARAWGKIAHLRAIFANKDWRGRAWYLERTFPLEFGRCAERDLPAEPEKKKISVAVILNTNGKTLEEVTNFPIVDDLSPPKNEGEPTALSTQDERIAEEFRAIERGRISSGKIVEIEGDISVGMKMKLGDFAEAISTRIWESVGRANWRNFEDARDFVRRLGLKNYTEWKEYCRSGKKPADIAFAPDQLYAEAGWLGWGDWLGTGRIAWRLRQYRSFDDARAFVYGLGLKSQDEWIEYCKSGKKPDDIPGSPENTYAKDGWSGMGDWLGTGFVAFQMRQHRSFADAREFVRRLGLKSFVEWSDYCRSGKKPPDIPFAPHYAYAEAGWEGYGDWLGTGRIAAQLREYWTFKKARSFVRRLGLKSISEWYEYCRSGKKPADIPSNPDKTYAKDGWSGMGDWLGTGRVAPGQYRDFKKARAFARNLGLKSGDEWSDYCKSGKKPNDIPAYPHETYANDGWAGYGDWHGYATQHSGTRAQADGVGITR